MNTFYKHQQDFLDQNSDKTTLVWSCGTGKTRTAIEWAKISYATQILIICPKALRVNWIREIEKYDGNHLNSWLVATKEEFRRDWEKLHTFEVVIVDEVHNGFLTPMFKSQMSKALKGYLKKHKVPRVLLLSATVYTSSPWNIYNLAHYTGHEWNYMTFKNEFFDHVYMGPRLIPVAKPNSEAKLAGLVKQIASVVDIYDVLDVPLQHHTEPEYFALTPAQVRGIENAYDPLPIVRYTYQHEIENGILIGNEFREDELFDCDKIDRIKQLVEENKKVAIVCRYNRQINKLHTDLKKITSKPVWVINGEVKDRDAVTLAAEKEEECVVIIQADCAEGYQLPSFGLCVFVSMSYSYTKYEQICGRFLRMDKPSRTTFLYLLTEGDSLDQAVYDSVMNKKNFQIELYKNEK